MVRTALILAVWWAQASLVWAGAPDGWETLTTAQQQVLQPVQSEWHQFPALQRQRLIVLANKFPAMKPTEQHRIQSKLREWAKLTPEQRTLARKNYRQLHQLPSDKRRHVKQRIKQSGNRTIMPKTTTTVTPLPPQEADKPAPSSQPPQN
ncbi:DUF3106 domain-containing protein [Chitinivorax sp. B]|uniref:DUF3106 domain-containing protein n=1 Tax=Chitinivorax sp. B TaxID=2502235 RepID=UPI0010F4C2D8|nr:DUF3106 domain-containing protein [Chitinivorax sp. B]